MHLNKLTHKMINNCCNIIDKILQPLGGVRLEVRLMSKMKWLQTPGSSMILYNYESERHGCPGFYCTPTNYDGCIYVCRDYSCNECNFCLILDGGPPCDDKSCVIYST